MSALVPRELCIQVLNDLQLFFDGCHPDDSVLDASDFDGLAQSMKWMLPGRGLRLVITARNRFSLAVCSSPQ